MSAARLIGDIQLPPVRRDRNALGLTSYDEQTSDRSRCEVSEIVPVVKELA